MVEAGNWSAIALWEPPDFRGKPFSEVRSQPGPVLDEWRETVRTMKERYLRLPEKVTNAMESTAQTKAGTGIGDPETSLSIPSGDHVPLRPFWHLAFLARDPRKPAVKGAISAVLKPYLDQAVSQGVPAWLEATNLHAVGVYKHMGFRLLEAVTIGKGKIGTDGWPKEGGDGVTAYIMIFDEHVR